jgi:hypothetical protein
MNPLIAITTIPLPTFDTVLVEALTLKTLVDYGTSYTNMEFFGSESMIGSDVLDIGSRNARRQRGVGDMNSLGNPGQFDLPNVQDVSSI